MKETILKDTLTMGTGGRYVRKFACNLSEISTNPAYGTVSANSAIPALFGRYCITGVKWTFIPLNTQSSSGTRPADRVCYAINRDPQDVLTGESDIIRQDDCKFTNSTRKFSVYVKHPKPILAVTANQTSSESDGLPPSGNGPTDYNTPTGGAGGVQYPNQVAFTLADNKWIWLPTRVARHATSNELGAPFDPGYETAQYPDHVGIDFVATANQTVDASYNMYNVYQTMYFALKEQD